MKKFILIILIFLPFIISCKKGKPGPPSPKHKLLVSYAEDYVYTTTTWINRDGWNHDDGSKINETGVSYNYWISKSPEAFENNIISSQIDNQIFWSEYLNYKPGGRKTDNSGAFSWTGTYCHGLVFWSAIKAGYSIDSSYLEVLPNWLNLGTEVSQAEIRDGDLVFIDFDTTYDGYEHLGIVWNILPEILSAVGIYSWPFEYKAGTHTIQNYNEVLPVEFQGLLPPGHPGYKVYSIMYRRLPE